MKIRRSYRFQLKINAQNAADLSRFAGCSRFVYNVTLSAQKERLDQREFVQTYAQMCTQLVALKQEYPFLAEVHSQPQQTLKDLERAIKDGMSQASEKGFPKFKKKGKQDSFRYPQGVTVVDDKIYLPKIGWLGFRSPGTSMVGVDLGCRNLPQCPTEQSINRLTAIGNSKKQLAKQQRALSRKIKFSANWKKQKLKVQRRHAKIANIRNDYLHKVSSELSKNTKNADLNAAINILAAGRAVIACGYIGQDAA
jgi:putative transposase